MLEKELETSPELRISTKRFSIGCIQAMFGYMYGGAVPFLTVKHGMELQRAAAEFQVIGLKERIELAQASCIMATLADEYGHEDDIPFKFHDFSAQASC